MNPTHRKALRAASLFGCTLGVLALGSCDTSPSLQDDTETRVACLCATPYESSEPLQRAYRNKDTEALAGLVDRGKALRLEKGTRIHVIDREPEISTVRIDSGRYTGERCYLWRRFFE